MNAGMETAWGHVPSLRFNGYTSIEYLRLRYELKHREIPPTAIVNLVAIDDREYFDEWFVVRIQINPLTDDLIVKPEDVVMWLPRYVLHVRPTGETFIYLPDGRMVNVITEEMIT